MRFSMMLGAMMVTTKGLKGVMVATTGLRRVMGRVTEASTTLMRYC